MPRLSCLVLTAAPPAPPPPPPQPDPAAPSATPVPAGLPPVPAAIAAAARPYSEFRAAGFWDWHPTRREMIIGTRFGDAPQLHRVRAPGGDRTQLTFFPDPVFGASYQPTDGRYIVFTKDVGGGEFFQKYRYDVATGEITLLAPQPGSESVAFGEAKFSRDGKGIFLSTDQGSEFQRLAYLDLATKAYRFLTTAIPWDVDEFDLSPDGRWIACVTDEDGVGVLHVINAATGAERRLPKLPSGLISDVRWRKTGAELGFTRSSARAPADAYSLDLASGTVTRWTESETAGLSLSDFAEAELVHWPSFDGRAISGFLYKPPARFAGRRPVIVNIHGGPEGQSRPGFLGRNNYYVNDLGVAIIFPNIRGSTGYGKTFTKLDNGVLRDGAYKDIGALLEWIRMRPDLDADHVLVTGGSYGGHMTLVTATQYDGPIYCSVDVVGMWPP